MIFDRLRYLLHLVLVGVIHFFLENNSFDYKGHSRKSLQGSNKNLSKNILTPRFTPMYKISVDSHTKNTLPHSFSTCF